MSNKTLKQYGYSGRWKAATGVSFDFTLPGCIELRNWQRECAFKLIDSGKTYWSIVAPTGSGKSIAINYLISHTLKRELTNKVIISVPQRAIGGGFSESRRFVMDKEKEETFDFYIKHDYCSDNYSADSKAEAVISFLEDDHPVTNSDKILLCVNNTLVNVYKRLEAEGRLHLLEGVSIWFDEAHHIQAETSEVSNNLGRLVNHCLGNGISINMVTATNFRGDRLSIIPREYTDSFARYTLAYDRHFSEHCGGMGFTYDFVLHKEDWYDAFERVLKEDKYSTRKTIVFIPHPNTNAFKSADVCKMESVKKTLSIIKGKKVTKKELICDSNGVMTLNGVNGKIRVIDLVSEEDRGIKVEHLRSVAGEEVDYVIGINVPKEGFDWPCANREFIIGPKSSLNELMQMMGRTFRGHEEYKGEHKDPVDIYHLLPWVDEKKVDADELKVALNDYLKAVYLSMIGESIMNPPSDIKVPTRKSETGEVDSVMSNEVMEYVIGVLGETGWETFLSGCVDECRKVRTDNEDMPNKERNELIRDTILGLIHDKEEIECFEDELCEIIFRSFVARSFNIKRHMDSFMEGIDVSGVDFDILSEIDSMDFLLRYANGMCNAATFKELREKIGERFIASAEQHREWIIRESYNSKKWYKKGYAKYKKNGAVYNPALQFGISWYWLQGMEEFADAEQHRKWITDESYSWDEWNQSGYKKYKSYGAYLNPSSQFNKPFKWFRSEWDGAFANAEQHRKWVKDGNYTAKMWAETGYKKFKSQGAYRDPARKLDVSWLWLQGKEKTEYADAEKHREWITEGKYGQISWAREGYKKYKHLGAYLDPAGALGVKWAWLRGIKNVNEFADAEQHRKWITEGGYNERSWHEAGYVKYKKSGALYNPNSLSVSWKWLQSKEEIEFADAEQHRKWITEGGYNSTSWTKTGHKVHKHSGAYRDPVTKFNTTWAWLQSKEEIEFADAEQHRKWITEGGYNSKSWKKLGYYKYKNFGAYQTPQKPLGVTWKWLRGLED